MRRLSTAVIAGLLLVGLIAAPAAADRDFSHGNFPHDITWINPHFDGPKADVVTGGWVGIWGAWMTATSEQMDEFLTVATFEIFCDGAARNVSHWSPLPDEAIEIFEALVEPMPAGRTTECSTVITFTDDHYDGWDLIPEGTVLEDTVTITAVPRGQFKKNNP